MQGCNENEFHGYVCGTWKNRGPCTRNGISEAVLLDQVADLLARELDKKTTLDRLRKRLEAGRTGKGETLRLAFEKGRKHVAGLEKQVADGGKRLLAVDADLLPDAQNELRRMKSELDAARADLAAVEKQAASVRAEEVNVEELLAGLAALPRVLRGADATKRARVVQLAVAKIVMRFETWRTSGAAGCPAGSAPPSPCAATGRRTRSACRRVR